MEPRILTKDELEVLTDMIKRKDHFTSSATWNEDRLRMMVKRGLLKRIKPDPLPEGAPIDVRAIENYKITQTAVFSLMIGLTEETPTLDAVLEKLEHERKSKTRSTLRIVKGAAE